MYVYMHLVCQQKQQSTINNGATYRHNTQYSTHTRSNYAPNITSDWEQMELNDFDIITKIQNF